MEQFKKDNLEAEKARHELKRAQEELSSVKKKVTQLEKKASKGPKENQDEVDDLKKLLYCSVCKLQPKDTMLLRCGHLFCHECIQVRYNSRQRKCPVCADPFAETDMKSVFL